MASIGRNTQGQTFIEFCCILFYIVYYVGFILIHNALARVVKAKAEWNYSHIMFKFYKGLTAKCQKCFAPLLLCHFRILNLQK